MDRADIGAGRPRSGLRHERRPGRRQADGRSTAAGPSTSAASVAAAKFVAEPERFISGDRSGLRHGGRPGDRAAHARSTAVRGSTSARRRCLERFEAEPARLRAGRRRRRPAAPPGTIYTCPMHPEIEQVGPGDCPICGMALEPKGGADCRRGAEPRARRLAAVGSRSGAALTVPLLFVSMGPMVGLPFHAWIGMRRRAGSSSCWRRRWCCGAAGRSSSAAGPRSARRRLNMFSLIAIGMAAAYLFSVVAVLAPALFPHGFRDHGGQVGVYFEAAAVDRRPGPARPDPRARARERTGAAIRALMGLAPKTARRVAAEGRRGRGRRSRRSASATCCGCGRARRCRSTAWWSKGVRP